METGEGAACIRLLDIDEARSEDGLLQCQLRDIDLNSESHAQYNALSYSWRKDMLRGRLSSDLASMLPSRVVKVRTVEQNQGNSACFILCNGALVHVQQNLHDFLERYCRRHDRGLLWIDAICIDQAESDPAALKEKYSQLQLMGRIYETAQSVLVWLGESIHVSSSVPELLRGLQANNEHYEHFRVENDVTRLAQAKSDFRTVLEILGLDESSTLPSLVSITKRRHALEDFTRVLHRDYFQRAWVVQELVLGKQLRFFIGKMELSLDDVLGGIRAALSHLNVASISMDLQADRGGFRELSHIFKAREDGLAGRMWSFDDFLFICRDRQATRPEDKVMSILGLVGEEDRQRLLEGVIGRDAASMGEVLFDKLYANCAVVLAESAGWPYVLSLVAAGAAMTEDLPSWVPDLRSPLEPKPFWYYGSTRHSAASSVQGSFAASGLADGDAQMLLTLSAAFVDEVEQIGETYDELGLAELHDVGGHLIDLLIRLGRNYAGTDERTMDAAMRTLTADAFEHDSAASIEKMRREFVMWIWTFGGGAAAASGMTRRVKSLLLGRFFGREEALECKRILGAQIRTADVWDAFVEMHDSEEYPFKSMFQGNWLIKHWDEAFLTRTNNPDGKAFAAGGDEPLFGGSAAKQTRPLAEGTMFEETIKKMEFASGPVLFEAISRMYKRRRIFRTKACNLVGIGPLDIRNGDLVWLVAGAPTPFLFRKVGTAAHGEQVFKLVGSAYLHGAMHGEMATETRDNYKLIRVI